VNIMMTQLSMIVLAAGFTLSCGDNIKLAQDAKTGGGSDAPVDTSGCVGCAAPPAIGDQMDRLGRPAVNTALDHGFDPSMAGGVAKDTYNQDGSPGGWGTYIAQFAANLAILDVLDTGVTCTNGTCTANLAATPSDGCGNQVFYNGALAGGGTAVATSYNILATVLSRDELFLDTTKTLVELPVKHQGYLAVELNAYAAVPNSTAGGRSPTMDVIDTTFTALSTGVNGFNLTSGNFDPAVGDGVGPHTDVSNTVFPFLGAPHS